MLYPCRGRRVLLALALASSLACGRDRLTGAGSGAMGDGAGIGSAGLNLPFDPNQGCRDYSSPGCSQCCVSTVDLEGQESCSIDELNTSTSLPGPCAATCPACARCSISAEQSLAEKADSARPDCNCPETDIVNDPCYDLAGCACFCSSLEWSLSACPQSASAACSKGNHCGAVLLVAPGPYIAGDEIEILWANFGSDTAFMGNCGGVAFARADPIFGSYITVSQAAPCLSTSAGEALAQGQTWSSIVIVPKGVGAGVFSLGGTYYFGCEGAAVAIGPATCIAGPIYVSASIGIMAN